MVDEVGGCTITNDNLNRYVSDWVGGNTSCGHIPCSELIRLNLSDNEFRGELPSTLPSSLQEIRVDRNDLSGSLPLDTIRNMKHLREFHADRNRLEGEVGDAFSGT